MAQIRATGTKPEMAVRRMVHAMGYRYRLHRRDLPGTPDLVFPARRKAIFVHGCFWHQHGDPNCMKASVPKSNQDYWLPKLKRNAERDADNQRKLIELGWKPMIIWECELEPEAEIAGRIREFLDAGAGTAG